MIRILFLAIIQLSFSQNERFAVHKVHDELYILRAISNISNPTTILYKTEKGLMVIDPSLDIMTKALKEKIKSIFPDEDVKFISSSHHHGDHTEGYKAFKRSKKILSKAQSKYIEDIKNIHHIDTEIKFKSKNDELIIFKSPFNTGHTDGDLFFHFTKSNYLYVGDYYFYKQFPIIDIKNKGDYKNYFKMLDYITTSFSTETYIIPGHSLTKSSRVDYSSMEEYKNHIKYLRLTIDFIRSEHTKGRTVKEIQDNQKDPTFEHFLNDMTFVNHNRWVKNVVNNYLD